MTNPTNTCGWLVQKVRPEPTYTPEMLADPEFEPWYPDFPEDCYVVVECGEAVEDGARLGLCPFHLGAMDMDGLEFEREVESGRSWS